MQNIWIDYCTRICNRKTDRFARMPHKIVEMFTCTLSFSGGGRRGGEEPMAPPKFKKKFFSIY